MNHLLHKSWDDPPSTPPNPTSQDNEDALLLIGSFILQNWLVYGSYATMKPRF